MSATFTVDTTDGVATLQFTDDKGDATAGPNDSVTGSPITPEVVSDNAAVSVDASAAGSGPGEFTAALTPTAEGEANLSVAPLVNSDGTPAVDAAGNPFGLPSPVAVTVTAGAADSLSMAVTG